MANLTSRAKMKNQVVEGKSVIDLVQLVYRFDRHRIFEDSTKKALRQTCKNLKAIVDDQIRTLVVPVKDLRELTKSSLVQTCWKLEVNGTIQRQQQLGYLFALEMPNLAELNLSELGGVPLEILACLRAKRWPKLRLLHLFLSGDQEYDMNDLLGADWSSLEDFHINIAANGVTVLHSDALIRQLTLCPSLKFVTLYGMDISRSVFPDFASSNCERLKSLGFISKLDDIDSIAVVVSIMALFDWPSLVEVKLEGLSGLDLEVIASSSWVKKVANLELHCFDPINGPKGFRALYGALSCGPLLEFTVYTPYEAAVEFENAHLPSLRTLECHVHGTPNDGDGEVPLDKLFRANLPMLHSVSIFLDRGLYFLIPKEFRSEEVLPSLKEFKLSCSDLVDNDMEIIALRLPKLEVLDLRCDEIQEDHIDYLFGVVSEHFSALSEFKLRKLVLHGLTYLNATELIGAASRMKSLEELDIKLKSSEDLCPKLIIAGGRLGAWPQLKILQFANLSYSSAMHLSDPFNWPQLELLTFSGNGGGLLPGIKARHPNVHVVYKGPSSIDVDN